MALSKIRTNFHSSSEALINKQINMELHASYVYMSMVSHILASYNINVNEKENTYWGIVMSGIDINSRLQFFIQP